MRIKLYKCNVVLFDIVKFIDDCLLIGNSGVEESVGRVELFVLMIVFSSSDGFDVVYILESYIYIGKGLVENEFVKSFVSISLVFMRRDEFVNELDIMGFIDGVIYKKF